jgi:hypothetical protein
MPVNGVAVHLGRVTIVVDPFHVIALANRAIDDVRRRVQNETLGHRGRSGDPLYEIRRLLLRGIERHTTRSRARLDAGLADGDPRDELLDTLLAKESLRSMYVAGTSTEAARRLDACSWPSAGTPPCPSSIASPRRSPAGARRSSPTTAPAPRMALYRSCESGREESHPCRPWIPQLQELPATGPPSLRGRMARCARYTNHRLLFPFGRVAPTNAVTV